MLSKCLEIYKKLENYGIDNHNLVFNGEKLETCFSNNQKLEAIVFLPNDIIIWTTGKGQYKSYVVTNSQLPISQKMYQLIIDELESQYNLISNVVKDISNSDYKKEIYNILIKNVILPFNKYRYESLKYNKNHDKHKYADEYLGSVKIEYGKSMIEDNDDYVIVFRDAQGYYQGRIKIVERPNGKEIECHVGGICQCVKMSNTIVADIYSCIKFMLE